MSPRRQWPLRSTTETTMSCLIGGTMRLSTRIAVAAVGLSALVAATACTQPGSSGGGTAVKNVEVFTWWADGGEKAGLDGLVSTFGTACSSFTFVNGAIAGGAGSNAKQ